MTYMYMHSTTSCGERRISIIVTTLEEIVERSLAALAPAVD